MTEDNCEKERERRQKETLKKESQGEKRGRFKQKGEKE